MAPKIVRLLAGLGIVAAALTIAAPAPLTSASGTSPIAQVGGSWPGE